MPRTPSTPIAANQMAMTGPNRRPTAPVPRCWSRNKTTMIAAVIGTTRSDSDGAATLTPSIADSTALAGDTAPADQGDQRHDAALAVVVGPHHQQDVRDGDDDRHRPEDQRNDPEDAVLGHLDRVGIARVEHRLDGVQRARADVSEDNAESTNRESQLSRSALIDPHGIRLPCR